MNYLQATSREIQEQVDLIHAQISTLKSLVSILEGTPDTPATPSPTPVTPSQPVSDSLTINDYQRMYNV